MKTVVDFFVIVIMTLTVFNGVLLTGAMGPDFMRPGMAQPHSEKNEPPSSPMGNMPPLSPRGNMPSLTSMGNLQLSSSMGNMPPLSSMGNMPPLSSMGNMPPLSSMGNMQPLSNMGNMQPLSNMGNMQQLSNMGNMQPLSNMGKMTLQGMVPRPSVGVSQNTKKIEVVNTELKEVIPIIDNGGLEPKRETELNMGLALKPKPASDLAMAVDAVLLPGPQIITNVETANTDNRSVENVNLSNSKKENLTQDVGSERNEVHTNLDDAVKDYQEISDDGHVPLTDKDNWKMTGDETWEDIKPTHGEENEINSDEFVNDIEGDEDENRDEVKDGDDEFDNEDYDSDDDDSDYEYDSEDGDYEYDYQEKVKEWLKGDDESADDEYKEEVKGAADWDFLSTTEKWDNPDSADSKESVAAGKTMMESTHHFDNNFGAFAGAKVNKGFMNVNKSSVYNWTFPSIAVMLAFFFIFWNRQKVAKYYVSMRLSSSPSSQNGQPRRRRDEEKDLLQNEYA